MTMILSRQTSRRTDTTTRGAKLNMSNIDLLIEELNCSFEAPETTTQHTIEELISKLTINIQTLTSYRPQSEDAIFSFFKHIKNLLIEGNRLGSYEFEDDDIFHLLAGLINVCDSSLVEKVYSQDDITEALQSNVASLFRIACGVIVKSNGKYLNRQVYLIFLTSYFDQATDIGIITEIEKTYYSLKNEIATEMLNLTIPELKKTPGIFKDNILFPRLIELFNIFIENTTNDFDFALFFDINIVDLIEYDIVNFINYSKFIIKTLEYIKFSFPSRTYLLFHVKNIIFEYGHVYSEIEDKYMDVKYFAKSNIFQIFKIVSDIDQGLMKTLETDYIKLNAFSPYLLDFFAFLNPKYLLDNHKNEIEECLEPTPQYLAILRNLISNESSFENLVKKPLMGKIHMPYVEKLVLIEKLTQYEYSARFLLDHCAALSSVLIDHKEISDTESKRLKEKCLSTLLNYPDDVLQIWLEPLSVALNQLRGSVGQKVQAMVEELTL